MKFMVKNSRFAKTAAVVLSVVMLMTTFMSTIITVFAATDQKPFTITVTDVAGEAIKGATVTITPVDTSLEIADLESVDTDAEGKAVFDAIYKYFSDNQDVTEFKATYKVTAENYQEEIIEEEDAIDVTADGAVSVTLKDSVAPVIKEVKGNPADWTKDNVTLEIVSDDTDIAEYINVTADNASQTEPAFTITQNGTYTFKLKDTSDNESAEFTVEVTKIDKDAPVIDGIVIDPDSWTKEEVKVQINATDSGSGISQYKIDDGEWVDSAIFTVKDAEEHIFYVKDKLDNIASESFVADKFDDVAPEITDVECEDGWSNESITYKVNATDNKSGVASYGIILTENKANTDDIAWQSSSEFVIEDTKLYSFFVKDNAGNISEADDMEEPAKIEKIAPVISDVTVTPDTWTNKPVKFTVVATDEGGSGIYQYRKDNSAWQDSNVFEDITDDLEHKFEVIDNAGNISTVFVKAAENYDDVKPVISAVNPSATEWVNEAITVTVEASDDKSGVYQYKMDDGEPQNESTFTIADAKTHTFEVIDNAGNISEAFEYSYEKFDAEKPVVKSIEFAQANSIDRVFNFLTFGIFFNSAVTVEIDAEDIATETSNASGIKSYSIYLYNENAELVYSDENKEDAKFGLSNDVIKNFKGIIKVVVNDVAGNTTGEVAATTANSNLKYFDLFTIENDAPVIGEIQPANDSKHKDDFAFEFNVNDKFESENFAGINSVDVTVNDVVVLSDDLTAEKTESKDYALQVDSANKTVNGVELGDAWNKGVLAIKVSAYDNSGNAAEAKSSVAYFDQTAPVIKGFDFSLANNIDVAKDEFEELYKVVEVEDYGFYFKENVVVTITATDLVNEEEEQVSTGVKSITYAAVDVDGTVKYSGTDDVDENNSISFEIAKDDSFKGQIYAYATDNVGNNPNNCVNCIDDKVITEGAYKGYVHPNGSVIESTDKHKGTSGITITAPEKTGTQVDSFTFEYEGAAEIIDSVKDYDDAQKVPLYNSEEGIVFNVNVRDEYSGIRSVTWTVFAGESKTQKTVTVDNDGNLGEDSEDWTIADEDDIDNLVYNLTGELKVTGNDNNMVLLVELTDRAGNTSYDYYVFGIDTTLPVIGKVEPTIPGWSNTTITYKVTATDEKSGIAQYGIILKENKDNIEDISWNENNVEGKDPSEFVIADTQLYSFFVKDNAGNISVAYSMDDPAKIEKIAPVISDVTVTPAIWTNQPVTFTVIATDEGGSEIAEYAMDGNWQTSNVFENIADDLEHKFEVKDNAGNVSAVFTKAADNYDDVKPYITAITPSTTYWTNEPIIVTITADDNKSGVCEYSMDGKWQEDNTFSVTDKKVHVFAVKDRAGNVSEITDAEGKYLENVTYQSDNYDVALPELKSVSFSQAKPLDRLFNFLTFGIFFNEKITIEVEAIDEGDEEISNASGVETYSIYFYADNDTVVYSIEGQESPEFTLNEEAKEVLENFEGFIKVKLTDRATNETGEIAVTAANSNLENFDLFTIENDAPVISEIQPANDSKHKDDFSFTFDVTDVTDKYYSGINYVYVTVNGVEVLKDELATEEPESEKIGSKSYTGEHALKVDSANKTVNGVELGDNWNKGELKISVTAYDNAGNVSATKESVAYFDQTAPVIKGFDFSLANNIDVDKDTEDQLYKAVTIEDYGFYFKENVVVTIKAEDLVNEDVEVIATGVKSITYAAVDIDGTVKYSGTADVDENNSISFEIAKAENFKGQIYAYATDNVGNNPNDCVSCLDDKVIGEGDYKGYVHPNGSVVESLEKHETTSGITINAPETTATQNNAFSFVYNGKAETLDATKDYDDTQKVPLYNTESVEFIVNVRDDYSGIRSVTWTVYEGEDGAAVLSKTVDVDNNRGLSEGNEEWSITDDNSADNLVYSLTGNLVVTGNHNNMVLLVELTDRAGNTSYDYYVFGIDTTEPVIKVQYNDNKAVNDGVYTDHFRTDREAVITVTERNFRAENVVTLITRDGKAITIVDFNNSAVWKEVIDEADLDKTTYTATVKYNVDGDYTFDISCTDNAENKNEAVDYGNSIAPRKFTIDKTIPTVTVTFDNNSAMNGNYYKADRIATITIVEHNFDARRVKLLETTPALSGWRSVGDTHTATIAYNTDGKYTLDIEFEDKAGNKIKDFAPQEFYVDKTNPAVSISGIADQSANNDEGNIGFIVTATDENFDSLSTVLTAVVVKDGVFESKNVAIGRTEDIAKGQRYVVANIAEDGIYSITCTVVDKAGNAYSEVTLEDANGKSYVAKRSAPETLVTFSVNRDGSIFTLDTFTKNLVKDYYVKDVAEAVTLIEINADPIVESKITLNGKALIKNVDYTVTVDNASSSWYKYVYKINKSLFEGESEYNVVISSKDKANNEAFSDVKDAAVEFVVDRTAPVITVTGLTVNGRYQVDKQIVTLVPNDDGGALKSLVVRLVDEDGKLIDELLNLSGEELAEALAEGTISFELATGLYQNVQIICEDYAGNIYGLVEDEIYKNVSVSSNAFLIFWANKPARWGTIGGIIALAAAATVLIVVLKKRKKDKK